MRLVQVRSIHVADGQPVPGDAIHSADAADGPHHPDPRSIDLKWPTPLRLAFLMGASLASWCAIILGAVWAFG